MNESKGSEYTGIQWSGCLIKIRFSDILDLDFRDRIVYSLDITEIILSEYLQGLLDEVKS